MAGVESTRLIPLLYQLKFIQSSFMMEEPQLTGQVAVIAYAQTIRDGMTAAVGLSWDGMQQTDEGRLLGKE